jgi:glucan phosphoethanolaminetransferase (alkaline phosphatase superfamily)
MCDVTDPTPTAGQMENTACSTVAGLYRVYRAVAWQRVDQIRRDIDGLTSTIAALTQWSCWWVCENHVILIFLFTTTENNLQQYHSMYLLVTPFVVAMLLCLTFTFVVF